MLKSVPGKMVVSVPFCYFLADQHCAKHLTSLSLLSYLQKGSNSFLVRALVKDSSDLFTICIQEAVGTVTAATVTATAATNAKTVTLLLSS